MMIERRSAAGRMRSKRRSLRPYQQVGLLVVAFAIAISLVFHTTGVGITSIDAHARTADRYYPVGQVFNQWHSQQLAMTAQYLGAMSAPDQGERNAVIAGIAAYYAKALESYNSYKRQRLGTSEEQRLFKKVDVAFSQLTTSSTQLVALTASTTGNTPEQIAAYRAQSVVLLNASDKLFAYYETGTRRSLASIKTQAGDVQRQRWLWGAIGLGLCLLASAFILRNLRHVDREGSARSHRAEVESRLQRALEMADSEEYAYEIIEEALAQVAPGIASEVLVADSSRAHFHQVVSVGEDWSGCAVAAPTECPAARRGQTQVWPSNTDLDACRYLRDRPSGPCAENCCATCVPVSIAGKTVGVIHAVAKDPRLLDRATVAKFELVARKAGERIGMLRAFSRSETQARTDPLTGLLNRRSLEDQARGLIESSDRYVVAFGDLDHFKMLNDVHGHDAGDRALRLFARILRDNVRPNDLPARYGGEEFVVVLPACSIDQAKIVIERIRDRLAASFDSGATSTFTVSFGLAVSDPTMTFGEVIDIADHALLAAKAAGRDRVIVANDPTVIGDVPRVDPPPTREADSRSPDNIPTAIVTETSGR